MPNETVYLTDQEVAVLRVFMEARILSDLTIAAQLRQLAAKLES